MPDLTESAASIYKRLADLGVTPDQACHGVQLAHNARANTSRAPVGFVPTLTDRETLFRIHDGAPHIHHGDLTRRLVKRILAVVCPVQSNECAIRGMCTNKCGALDRCAVNPTTGTWICPTCGDPKCGEV